MGLSSPLYCLIFISFLVDSEAGLPSYGLWGNGFRSAHRLAARAQPPHRKEEFLAPDLLVGRGPLVIGGPELLATHHPSPELSTQFHWRAGQLGVPDSPQDSQTELIRANPLLGRQLSSRPAHAAASSSGKPHTVAIRAKDDRVLRDV